MSSNTEKTDDPIWTEAFLFGLIVCSKCASILDFKDAGDPMTAWAKEASQTAKELGWRANGNSEVLCPNCDNS